MWGFDPSKASSWVWANESFETLLDTQKDREYSEDKQLQDELIEGQFNLLDEVINLKVKLTTLVEPNEAKQIQTRLFLKYKKNPDNFDFFKSLN